MSSRTSLDHQQTDYFTIIPPPHSPAYDHFSTETPCCSPAPTLMHDASSYPEHPLLAYRETQSPSYYETPPRMASHFMAVQTSAAHNTARPRPQPMQNVLHVTSDDSTGSDSSHSSRESISCLEAARCSRCQRTPSIDVKTGNSNMVAYGLNLWYCSRCAAIVGLNKR